jgi:hypothetical protein
MRALSPSVLAFAGVLAVALPAGAVAPCPDTCHFSQGQPLLLADVKQLWVRPCDTPTGGTETCVAQRLDRSGKVLAVAPVPTLFDGEFPRRELEGHTVVGLHWQSPWADLTRPYAIQLAGQTVQLSIEKDTLVCTAPGSPVTRRPLGCAPKSARPFAGFPKDPGVMVLMATCAIPSGEHEVVATCDVLGGTP